MNVGAEGGWHGDECWGLRGMARGVDLRADGGGGEQSWGWRAGESWGQAARPRPFLLPVVLKAGAGT